MARRRKEVPAVLANGRLQSPLERRLCNAICFCQLLSIISGVSFFYLAFIVIKPSQQTLWAEFVDEPVVCTTLSTNSSSTTCDRPSCAEWCLSSSGGSCPVISAYVRRPGASLTFRGCQSADKNDGLRDDFCSEMSDDHLQTFICAEGEHSSQCHKLSGLFNCSETQTKQGRDPITSLCRNVSALFSRCEANFPVRSQVRQRCNHYACNDLRGVYECVDGSCRQVENATCQKRCDNLNMGNVAVVTADRFHYGSCQAVERDGRQIWNSSQTDALAVFCTRLRLIGDRTQMLGEDCVNGTLIPTGKFVNLTKYRLVRAELRRHEKSLLAVAAEEILYNRTQVMVNIEGCVNTLRSDCKRWHAQREVDGSDGRHPAVYPCYITPHSADYVITDYSRRETVRQMMLAATLPCVFIVLSCFSLCLCGRMVAVSEYGVFYCRGCRRREKTPSDPDKSSTL